MTDEDLSSQQKIAVESLLDWYHSRWGRQQVFYLAGYAGTGKTWLLRHVVPLFGCESRYDCELDRLVDGVVFGAYTGKAARVMAKNGLKDATTIHSLCYKPVCRNEEAITLLQQEIKQLPSGSDERALKMQALRALQEPQFVLNEEGPAARARLIVLDECSMINEEMGFDILSFEVPVLVVGDPGQLPPIEGGGFFTEHEPDVMLTEIHRQAAGNPIIKVATMARQGERIPFGRHGRSVVKWPKRDLANGRGSWEDQLDRLKGFEQVLVGKNSTRRFLNRLIRAARGLESPAPAPWLPNERDKVIIRRNVRRKGLLNGDFAVLSNVKWRAGMKTFTADVTAEHNGITLPEQHVYAGRFIDHYDYQEEREAMEYQYRQGSILADFGYALTTHVAQGSQFRSTLVVDERMKGSVEDHHKWLYTSLTRAEVCMGIFG